MWFFHADDEYENRAQAPVKFRAGALKQNQGQHAEYTGGDAHVDGPQPAPGGLQHRLPLFHIVVMHVVQSLVHDKNGIVDYDADKDDKAEHGENIPGPGCRTQHIEKLQADKAAGAGQGHGEHDDRG